MNIMQRAALAAENHDNASAQAIAEKLRQAGATYDDIYQVFKAACLKHAQGAPDLELGDFDELMR